MTNTASKMTEAAARELRAAWNADVKALSRKTRAQLLEINRAELASRGTYRVFGNLSKDELVNDTLDMRYPRQQLNESIHVLYHVDGVTNSVCEYCAAVARVIARGSSPEAIEDAEGDFGPGGIFAPSVPGLAEHTAAAQDKIIEASR